MHTALHWLLHLSLNKSKVPTIVCKTKYSLDSANLLTSSSPHSSYCPFFFPLNYIKFILFLGSLHLLFLLVGTPRSHLFAWLNIPCHQAISSKVTSSRRLFLVSHAKAIRPFSTSPDALHLTLSYSLYKSSLNKIIWHVFVNFFVSDLPSVSCRM